MHVIIGDAEEKQVKSLMESSFSGGVLAVIHRVKGPVSKGVNGMIEYIARNGYASSCFFFLSLQDIPKMFKRAFGVVILIMPTCGMISCFTSRHGTHGPTARGQGPSKDMLENQMTQVGRER